MTIRMRLILALLPLFLSACAVQNSGVESKLYLLSSNSDSFQKPADAPVIGLKPVTVAEYLENQGIAVLVDNSRLRIANYHYWAEAPETAITRVMHSDLNRLMQNYAVDNGQLGREADWVFNLDIHVDQFHGTDDGLAVFSGYWRLSDTEKVLLRKRFNLSAAIEEPGYAPLVSKLRQLLSELARMQVDEVETLLEKRSSPQH